MIKTVRPTEESPRRLWPMVGMVAVYLITIVIVTAQGARPMVDEWIYIDAARQFAESGRIEIAPISFAVAIFEAIYGGAVIFAFGESNSTLVMATALLAGAAGVSLWDLLTMSGARSGTVFVVLGSFLFSAVFYGLTTTYMTDAHAVSLTIISAALYSRGIDREERGRGWLLAGSCAAAAAYLSRPGALGVVAGVALIAFSRRERSSLVWAIFVPAITVTSHLVANSLGIITTVRSDIVERLGLPSLSTARDVVIVAAISIGIALIPLAPAIFWSITRRQGRYVGVALAATAVILIVLWTTGDIPVVGNWLNPTGMYPIDQSTVGHRPPLLGWPAYFALVVMACLIAVSAFITIAGSRIKPKLASAEIGLWAAAFLSLALVLVTQVATLDLVLDRYFIVLLPPILFSLVVRGRLDKWDRFRSVGTVLLGFTAALSVILAVDGMRVQNAVFVSAGNALSEGIEATKLDGGAAWTGITFGLDMDPSEQIEIDDDSWWWGRFAPEIQPRYVITLNPDETECVRGGMQVATIFGPNIHVDMVDTEC